MMQNKIIEEIRTNAARIIAAQLILRGAVAELSAAVEIPVGISEGARLGEQGVWLRWDSRGLIALTQDGVVLSWEVIRGDLLVLAAAQVESLLVRLGQSTADLATETSDLATATAALVTQAAAALVTQAAAKRKK